MIYTIPCVGYHFSMLLEGDCCGDDVPIFPDAMHGGRCADISRSLLLIHARASAGWLAGWRPLREDAMQMNGAMCGG